jgi:hypothetical protein
MFASMSHLSRIPDAQMPTNLASTSVFFETKNIGRFGGFKLNDISCGCSFDNRKNSSANAT